VTNGYLERHYKEGIQLPIVNGWEEMEEREVMRIRRALSVTILAGTLPNRTGDPVTDKRKARRVSHALRNALKGWTKISNQLPLDDAVRREALRVEWSAWCSKHISVVETEIAIIATWAIQNDLKRWGRSAVVNLENEYNWVTYAIRT